MTRVALLALVLVAAGCGGGARDIDPATLVPRDTVRFFTAETSSDWRQLANAFVGDVQVQKDADAFAVAIRRNGKRVDLYRRGGTWSGDARHTSLADDVRYRTAQDDVPSDALARGWLRGNAVKSLLQRFPGQLVYTIATARSQVRVRRPPAPRPSIAFLQYRWGVGWLTKDGIAMRAKNDGLPLAESFRVRTIEGLAAPYAPALYDEIPADVTAFMDFPMTLGSFSLQRELPRQVARLFPDSTFALPQQLDAIFNGETAVYWRKGGEVTVVTSPADLGAAESALADLLPVLRMRVHHTLLGGQLVISTRKAGLDAFRGGGAKLASREFGFPEEVSAAFWVGPDAPASLGRRPLTAWVAPEGADPTFTVRFGS